MISQFGRRVALIAACSIGLSAQAASGESSAATKPDPEKGRQIAASVCIACHGIDGNSTIPANPKLNGQHADYLVKQLADYAKAAGAAGARANPVMAGFAAPLSADDRRNLAAWFATQKPTPGAAHNKETLVAGQRIYRAGIPAKNVPACAGCHTPTGAGIPAQYPRVSGQHADYGEAQLKLFRDGGRGNSATMQQIAARLSDAEIRAVADYMAGLQ